MPGLTKEQIPQAPNQSPPSTASLDNLPMESPCWHGVPVEVYRYFNQDIGTTDEKSMNQLKDIYQIAKETTGGTLEQVLDRINSWELKVGSPSIVETRHSKMWNYVKIQHHINNLLKEQKRLERTANVNRNV